jgi:hypothetical protein
MLVFIPFSCMWGELLFSELIGGLLNKSLVFLEVLIVNEKAD